MCSSREIIEKSNSVSLEGCHIFNVKVQLPVFVVIHAYFLTEYM